MVTVLVLPPIPASLNYRFYLDRVESDRPFLCTIGAWLTTYFGGPKGRVVVCHNDFLRADEIATAASQVGVEVRLGVAPSLAELLLQVCDEQGTSEVIFVSPGSCILPRSVIDELVRCHLAGSNSLTSAIGLPRGAFLDICSASLLRSLRSYAVAFPESPPGVLLAQLFQYRRTDVATISERAAAIPIEVLDSSIDSVPQSSVMMTREELQDLRELLGGRGIPESGLLREWKLAATRRTISAADNLRTEFRRHSTWPQSSVGLRVLYYSSASAFSGAEESLAQLAATMSRIPPFTVFAHVGFDGVFSERLRGLGVSVSCSERDLATESVRTFGEVSKLLDEKRPDIIHFNGREPSSAWAAALSSGVRIVQHIRVAELSGYCPELHYADRIVCVSKFVEKEVRRLDGVADDRVTTVYNGVDMDAMDPRTLTRQFSRSQLDIPLDAIVFLIVARFAPNKRHDILIDAVAQLGSSVPKAIFMLLGDAQGQPRHASRVFTSIERKQLRDRFKLLGFRTDMPVILKAADVLLMCSDREPAGRGIQEAQSMGLPVVVTDNGGSHELVRDQISGLVIKAGDPACLAQAILTLSNDHQLRARLGAGARIHAMESFPVGLHAQAIRRIYDEVS